MNSTWNLVRIDKILKLQRRWIQLKPLQQYQEIGLRSFGKGIFHKTPVIGADLGDKRVLEIHPGDLIFSNVFAWEGAVGVATEAERGMIGSHRFVTYTPIYDSCCVEYLQLFFHSPEGLEVVKKVSPGSAGRNRTLNLKQFDNAMIPLPPIAEQRRIVARIEELVAKIEEVRRLRESAIRECDMLCRSIIFSKSENQKLTPLKELVRLRELDIEVTPFETYSFAGVYGFGRGVFKQHSLMGNEFSYKKLTRLKFGNFVYPKLMAWEGALGTVPEDCDGLVVSPEFPVFEVNEDRVLPETLDVYFRTPSVWSRWEHPTLAKALHQEELSEPLR